uniref:LRRCT domain-containing protein n=1 Tax=Branchiostoma floridae TaxID=7739 RepID=C3XSX8_BRAFL|eukprot:XP_002612837.1 hypothetical protein BRAFLDRAFT_67215 [Branchiostoma floridae]
MKTAIKFKSQKRRKSFLPVITIVVCLCMACSQEVQSLPQKCTNSGTSNKVGCNFLELTAFPEGIPANTAVLDLQQNAIRNLTDVPVLKNLIRLFLQDNRIETVDWEALGNLPSLKALSLKRNRLTHVSLDLTVQNLPSLTFLSLEFNQLTSFTKEQLGHPTLTSVRIRGNPLDCSCTMLWMITDLKCLQEHYSLFDHCERCDACVIPSYPNPESYKCNSPAHLKGHSLTSVAQHLTNCGDESLDSTTAETTNHATSTQDQSHETTTKHLGQYLEKHNNATSLSNDCQDPTTHLKGNSLTNVSQHLTNCGDEKLASTSAQDEGQKTSAKHLGQYLENNNASSLPIDSQDPTSPTTIENGHHKTTPNFQPIDFTLCETSTKVTYIFLSGRKVANFLLTRRLLYKCVNVGDEQVQVGSPRFLKKPSRFLTCNTADGFSLRGMATESVEGEDGQHLGKAAPSLSPGNGCDTSLSEVHFRTRLILTPHPPPPSPRQLCSRCEDKYMPR